VFLQTTPLPVSRQPYSSWRRAIVGQPLAVALVVYVFASSLMWASVSPPGGLPDEPAHITYAAGVVRGDLGSFGAVDHPNYAQLAIVDVPFWVGSITDPRRSAEAYRFPCYATVIERTADCAPAMSDSTDLTPTPTTVTRYPPAYYWIIGLPTLALTGETAVLAMRIVAAALASAMVALGFSVVSKPRRPWMALGILASFTPMAAHYAGSANPSGLEISAVVGLGTALLGLDWTDLPLPRRSAIVIGFLAATVAWSRPRMWLMLGAAVIAIAALNWRSIWGLLQQRSARWIIGVIAGAGVATAWLFNRSFTDMEPVLSGDAAAVTNPASAQLGLLGNASVLERRWMDWGFHLVGRFGWLDHSPPRSVWLVWLAVALVIIGLAVTLGNRHQRVALGAAVIWATVVAPIFVFASAVGPLEYQARYHLPLASLVLLGAAGMLARTDPNPGRLGQIASTVLPVTMAISVASSLYRYGLGGEAQLANLPRLLFDSWQWVPRELAPVGLVVGVLLLIPAVGSLRRHYRELSTSARRVDTGA